MGPPLTLCGHFPLSFGAKTEEAPSKNGVPIPGQLQNVRSKLPSAENGLSDRAAMCSRVAIDVQGVVDVMRGRINARIEASRAEEVVSNTGTVPPPVPESSSEVPTGLLIDIEPESQSVCEVPTGLLVDLRPESDGPAESESSDNSSEILPRFKLDPPNHKETVQQLKARMQAKVAQRENDVETPKAEAAPTMPQNAVSGHSLLLPIAVTEGAPSPENETPVLGMFQPYRAKVTPTATAVPQSVSNVRAEPAVGVKPESGGPAENASSDDSLDLTSFGHDQKLAIIKARLERRKRASLGENGAVAPKAETVVPSGENAVAATAVPSNEAEAEVVTTSAKPKFQGLKRKSQRVVVPPAPPKKPTAAVVTTPVPAKPKFSEFLRKSQPVVVAPAPRRKPTAKVGTNPVQTEPKFREFLRKSQPVVVAPVPRQRVEAKVITRPPLANLQKTEPHMQSRRAAISATPRLQKAPQPVAATAAPRKAVKTEVVANRVPGNLISRGLQNRSKPAAAPAQTQTRKHWDSSRGGIPSLAAMRPLPPTKKYVMGNVGKSGAQLNKQGAQAPAKPIVNAARNVKA